MTFILSRSNFLDSPSMIHLGHVCSLRTTGALIEREHSIFGNKDRNIPSSWHRRTLYFFLGEKIKTKPSKLARGGHGGPLESFAKLLLFYFLHMPHLKKKKKKNFFAQCSPQGEFPRVLIWIVDYSKLHNLYSEILLLYQHNMRFSLSIEYHITRCFMNRQRLFRIAICNLIFIKI